ncbi:MAG: hypothetical protein IJS08_15655 [Victivallales bacterium]|nr:hypothetical protein [Victivallales bacterium]
MTIEQHHYTDEKNAQIVIALLKAHGIRKIVANPGTTNLPFVGSVQNDSWFQVFSGIDERHSAYMAVGMAAENGEPVVLSCTGATASRNYFPALTEAYYRKLPILALTSIHHLNDAGNLIPQMLDRSNPPKDAVVFSLSCPVPHTKQDVEDCVSNINKALLELFRHGGGPVHINLETERTFTFNTETLPEIRVIRRVSPFQADWPIIEPNWKIAVWATCHKRFSHDEISVMERFVKAHNAVVLTDRTSSTYFGHGVVGSRLLIHQRDWAANAFFQKLIPDLVIQIGEVPGDYSAMGIAGRAKHIWRVSEDGEVRDLFHKLTYVFEMPEAVFFQHYADGLERPLEYAALWNEAADGLQKRLPELPFSNIWIASQLHDRLPKGSEIHLGILNSLRSWNMFPLPEGVTSASNVGGFGIDGCISTLIGASLASPQKLFFGVFGDLAFFYDLNALGNRHIGKNLRILVVNNGCGAEFTLSAHPASQFGEQTLDYLAAGHHFGNGSRTLVKHYAEDLGFLYLSASNKEEFLAVRDEFLSSDGDRSVLFECFTNQKAESDALEEVKGIEIQPPAPPEQRTLAGMLKSAVPQRVKNAIKELVK